MYSAAVFLCVVYRVTSGFTVTASHNLRKSARRCSGCTIRLLELCKAFGVQTENGAVAQPPKRKTEVKAKKGFTTSVFCFKFNSCEQKNSKARTAYRNFGKKSTVKISDADRNKNIEAQRALSGKHPA